MRKYYDKKIFIISDFANDKQPMSTQIEQKKHTIEAGDLRLCFSKHCFLSNSSLASIISSLSAKVVFDIKDYQKRYEGIFESTRVESLEDVTHIPEAIAQATARNNTKKFEQVYIPIAWNNGEKETLLTKAEENGKYYIGILPRVSYVFYVSISEEPQKEAEKKTPKTFWQKTKDFLKITKDDYPEGGDG